MARGYVVAVTGLAKGDRGGCLVAGASTAAIARPAASVEPHAAPVPGASLLGADLDVIVKPREGTPTGGGPAEEGATQVHGCRVTTPVGGPEG